MVLPRFRQLPSEMILVSEARFNTAHLILLAYFGKGCLGWNLASDCQNAGHWLDQTADLNKEGLDNASSVLKLDGHDNSSRNTVSLILLVLWPQ